jgi:hypothetical protein
MDICNENEWDFSNWDFEKFKSLRKHVEAHYRMLCYSDIHYWLSFAVDTLEESQNLLRDYRRSTNKSSFSVVPSGNSDIQSRIKPAEAKKRQSKMRVVTSSQMA